MLKRRLLTLCCLLLPALAAAPSAGEELLLYAPQPSTQDMAPSDPGQGVLVKTVTVKRGDTLKKLSRKHIGVSSWFPQVLLFNKIKNPDRIYPGEKLLVPVRPGKAVSNQVAKGGPKASAARSAAKAKPAAAAARSKSQVVKPGEKEMFQRARRAYLDRDYQKALAQFSSFLRTFPRSSLAADAALYRANSLLRLSEE